MVRGGGSFALGVGSSSPQAEALFNIQRRRRKGRVLSSFTSLT